VTMEHSLASPFLHLRAKCMYLYITQVLALYAGTELMNEISALRKIVGLLLVCLSIILVISIICRLDLFSFSYVGPVVCWHQRPLFDLATVHKPASWLSISRS
jgi:hypothetical protein